MTAPALLALVGWLRTRDEVARVAVVETTPSFRPLERWDRVRTAPTGAAVGGLAREDITGRGLGATGGAVVLAIFSAEADLAFALPLTAVGDADSVSAAGGVGTRVI